MVTLLNWVSRVFGRRAVSESVATRMQFGAGPEAVWNELMFYEDVPGRPSLLLRAALPRPISTKGTKNGAGALVSCDYGEGSLTKRITAFEPPRLMGFAVIDQRLGIEACCTLVNGSYEFRPRGSGTEAVLTTNYLAHLHPRLLWRPLERWMAGQLHRHILRGMRAALAQASPVKAAPGAAAERSPRRP
ncbi:MAG TPA: hypothetical protein VEH49_00030 [Methylomirabilota bacterium]|nr:hypothetical protein [Methylomirabilota bacterium]